MWFSVDEQNTSWSDCNEIRTHSYLFPKWLGLAKWLSVHLRTKWLCIQISLLSIKLKCGFTLKHLRDIITPQS